MKQSYRIALIFNVSKKLCVGVYKHGAADSKFESPLEDQGIINEFLIESSENLARLDQEMVELERRPEDAQLLASVFRTTHTIKGDLRLFRFHHTGSHQPPGGE